MITTGWPTDQGIPEDISGGPWELKLENIDVSSQVVTLTPNENYWGEKPGLAALVYQNIGNDPGAAVAALQNDEVVNNRIYCNNQPQYEDTAPEQYNAPDAAAAKALLEESGYVLGGDGVYEHPDRGRLALAISTTVNNPLRQQTIDVIIPQAAEAGFEITARPDPDIFSDATVPTSLEAGGFDIALFAWVGSPFRTATASIYQSLEAQGGSQGQNYTHGGNPEVDALGLLRNPAGGRGQRHPVRSTVEQREVDAQLNCPAGLPAGTHITRR